MEKKIQITEDRLQALENESQLPENMASPKKLTELFKAISDTQLEIEKLYARWSELEKAN